MSFLLGRIGWDDRWDRGLVPALFTGASERNSRSMPHFLNVSVTTKTESIRAAVGRRLIHVCESVLLRHLRS